MHILIWLDQEPVGLDSKGLRKRPIDLNQLFTNPAIVGGHNSRQQSHYSDPLFMRHSGNVSALKF